ncbi:DUF488 domain-containing protein [Treponema primitia]|uniref:DUF488 family protein, N3 subclade n=1 Tax=Treponema primitia TaxID=88058 RepID=UPI003980B5AE
MTNNYSDRDPNLPPRSNIPANPVYKRQRFLLSFIKSIKEPLTLMDLQKLLFLYSEKQKSDFYEFIPYFYGCYSLQAAEDLNTLERNGWIKKDKNNIKFGFPDSRNESELPFNDNYVLPQERGSALVKFVYDQYPYYAINSKIAHGIMDRPGLIRIDAIRKSLKKNEQILFTIGYEGISIEKYLNTLIKNDIRILCDVRNNPLSRKFGFSKTNLQYYLKNINIEYVHIPELGIVSEKRQSLETEDDYTNLFNNYEKSLTTKQTYLEKVYQLLISKKRIALTCFEHDPQHCHRHIISEQISKDYTITTKDL